MGNSVLLDYNFLNEIHLAILFTLIFLLDHHTNHTILFFSHFRMSPDRSSGQDGSTKILTKMPIERNHILVQQPQPQQQYLNNNNNNIKNSILNLDTTPNCSNSNELVHTTAVSSSATPTSITASKIIVVNEMTDNYISE